MAMYCEATVADVEQPMKIVNRQPLTLRQLEKYIHFENANKLEPLYLVLVVEIFEVVLQ